MRNRYKDKCRFEIGSSFILDGYYCVVTRVWGNYFLYNRQDTGFSYKMSYEDYLKTPSAAGRKLNV